MLPHSGQMNVDIVYCNFVYLPFMSYRRIMVSEVMNPTVYIDSFPFLFRVAYICDVVNINYGRYCDYVMILTP